MNDLTKEDQAIDEARNELWYASNPKHNVTELEFTAFDCAWEACSAYKQKRITALERENARLRDERYKMTTRAANKQKRITELETAIEKIWVVGCDNITGNPSDPFFEIFDIIKDSKAIHISEGGGE